MSDVTAFAGETGKKFEAILAEKIGTEAMAKVVTGNEEFIKDLGADSLDSVEIVMALEEAFDVSIPDDAAEGLTTPNAVRAFLDQKLGLSAAA